MKNIKKTTAILLLCSVTFMTLSSFTLPVQNDLLGSANALNCGVPGTQGNPTGQKQSVVTFLLVTLFAVVSATQTSASSCNAAAKTVNTTNAVDEAYLMHKLN